MTLPVQITGTVHTGVQSRGSQGISTIPTRFMLRLLKNILHGTGMAMVVRSTR